MSEIITHPTYYDGKQINNISTTQMNYKAYYHDIVLFGAKCIGEESGGLPTGYTQYSYLENTNSVSTSYVDLKYISVLTDEIELTAYVPNSSVINNSYMMMFGSTLSGSNNSWTCILKCDSGFHYGTEVHLAGKKLQKVIAYTDTWQYPNNYKSVVKINSTTIQYKAYSADTWTTLNRNIDSQLTTEGTTLTTYAFNQHKYNQDDYSMPYKIYNIIIRDTTTSKEIHNFIPCVEDSSGNKGFYDIIAKVFCPCSNNSYYNVGNE